MEKNKFGEVVFKKKIEDVSVEVSVSSNPFGEHYIIVSAMDSIISGTTIERKKNGDIEFRNRPIGTVKIQSGVMMEKVSERTL